MLFGAMRQLKCPVFAHWLDSYTALQKLWWIWEKQCTHKLAKKTLANCGCFGAWRSSLGRGSLSHEKAARRPQWESMESRYDLWKRLDSSGSMHDKEVELIPKGMIRDQSWSEGFRLRQLAWGEILTAGNLPPDAASAPLGGSHVTHVG